MNHHFSSICAAAAATWIVSGCAGLEPRSDHWNAPPVGATWQVAQRNTGSYGKDAQFTVTRVDATWQGQPAVGYRASNGLTTLAHPVTGRWMAVLTPDGKPVVTFDPPIGWDHPIKVGNSWKTHEKVTMGGAPPSEFDYSCKAEGYEKVTVPAGTFDTFRIACRSSTGGTDSFWMSPSIGLFVKLRMERGPGDASGAGTKEEELVSFQPGR